MKEKKDETKESPAEGTKYLTDNDLYRRKNNRDVWTCASCGLERDSTFHKIHVRVRNRTVALICDEGNQDRDGRLVVVDCEAAAIERLRRFLPPR